MRNNSIDLLGAVLKKNVTSGLDSVTRVHHVVDKNCNLHECRSQPNSYHTAHPQGALFTETYLIFDIADEKLHRAWSIWLVTFMSIAVDESKVDIESVSYYGSTAEMKTDESSISMYLQENHWV